MTQSRRKEKRKTKRRGRKTGMDLASSTRAAENMTKWKRVAANPSVGGAPTTFKGYEIEWNRIE